MPGYAYLDASAVVKLVVAEPESGPLERDILERDGLISSAIVTTEVRRAAARVSRRFTQQANAVLEALVLSHVTPAILDRAAALQPTQLRTLDAIHLATALDLEIADLTFISYDRRLFAAARAAGLRVAAPR